MKLQWVAAGMLTCFALVGCAAEAPPSDVPAAEDAVAAASASGSTAPGRAVPVEGGEYRDIMVPELQAMLQQKDFPLINVHVPFAGNIPGTDAMIRYDEVAANLDQLPADKNARVVLYCRTGPMSERAARDLVALGYTDVYNVVGGFNAWVEAGLPLETQAP